MAAVCRFDQIIFVEKMDMSNWPEDVTAERPATADYILENGCSKFNVQTSLSILKTPK